VRRFYPFFPVLGGRALVEFDWRGRRFVPGDWVLLDLFGTNRDPRIWGDPEAFRPDRFRGWSESPFNFIPQGGGEFTTGHRCPGEPATIALMRTAVKMLTSEMRYIVPEQDLTIDLRRIPALPRSRFVISRVSAARVDRDRPEIRRPETVSDLSRRM
jgi:fatty-acid peroxygenase